MKIYVDGSFKRADQIIGYAFAIVLNEQIIYTYKNAMRIKYGNSVLAELIGVINALEFCLKNGIEKVTIVHDYDEIPMYASLFRRSKNSKINFYARRLRDLCQKIDVSFLKVKAHKNDVFNNYVDMLSRECVNEFSCKNNVLS